MVHKAGQLSSQVATLTKALVKYYNFPLHNNYYAYYTDNIISVTEEQYMAVRSYSTSIGGIALSELPVQFRFVQLDHRGGFCDCWAVANLTVTPPNGQTTELSYVSHFSKYYLDYWL